MKTSKKSLALAVILSLGVCANAWAATAIGDGVNEGEGATATGSLSNAIGFCAQATGTNGIAIGTGSQALAAQSNAIGVGAIAGGNNTNAIGVQAVASGAQSNAIGVQANAVTDQSIAIGMQAVAGFKDDTGARPVVNPNAIAVGVAAKALGSDSTAIGTNSNASGGSSFAIGLQSSSSGMRSSAIGYWSNASGEYANAIGPNTRALGADSTAIGHNAYTYAGTTGANAIGWGAEARKSYATAIGEVSVASGEKSNAIGKEAHAEAQNANAIGYSSRALGDSSNAIGYLAQAKEANSNAIGTNARAFAENSVAIGYNSYAGEKDTVSVGLVNAERRIVNVAAAEKFTDALTFNNFNYITEGEGTSDEKKYITDMVIGNQKYYFKVGETITLDKELDSTSTNGVENQAVAKADIATNDKIGDINNYTSHNYIKDGDSTVTSISNLDKQVKINENNIGDVNNYSSTNYIKNGDSAATSLGNLDKQVKKNADAIINETNERIEGDKNLQEQINNLGGNLASDVERLDSDVKSVGAMAAAMAGLHPRFTGDGKGEVAAAIGSYDGKKATAIGAFYAPDERFMFSLGGAFAAGGKKMANLGVNIALDPKPHVNKKFYEQEIAELKADVNAKLAEKDAQIEALMQRLAALEARK